MLQKSRNYGVVVISLKKIAEQEDYKFIGIFLERIIEHAFGERTGLNYRFHKKFWIPEPKYFEPEKRKTFLSYMKWVKYIRILLKSSSIKV